MLTGVFAKVLFTLYDETQGPIITEKTLNMSAEDFFVSVNFLVDNGYVKESAVKKHPSIDLIHVERIGALTLKGIEEGKYIAINGITPDIMGG
ncbi:MAG TPA: hypothetical protein PKJ95_00005 [Atribacterota bacterium]|nr:hypothetical protein [Atribacterota bacterium]